MFRMCSFEKRYQRRLWGRGNTVQSGLEKQRPEWAWGQVCLEMGHMEKLILEWLLRARLWRWRLGVWLKGSPQISKWWEARLNSALGQRRVTGTSEGPFRRLRVQQRGLHSLKRDETTEQEWGQISRGQTGLVTDQPQEDTGYQPRWS